MAKERLISIPQTKSDFSLAGKLKGVEKDDFYKDIMTKKTNKPFRALNFGIEYEKGKTVYVNLAGMARPKVYFYKKSDVVGQKGNTVAVEWDKRATFNSEGYQLMGISCGLEKNEDDGKNIIKNLSEFDACEYIAKKLRALGDDTTIRVVGELSYSRYTNKNGDVINQTKYEVKRIYLSNEKLDEEAKQENHFFHQTLAIKDVEKDEENKRFLINGYVIGYENIENTTLFTKNAKLASTLKKISKKDFVGLSMYGEIDVIKTEEEEVEEDEWGEKDTSKNAKAPTIRELYVTGAEKETLDTESFTEEKISAALVKIAKNQKAVDEFNGKSQESSILEVADSETDDAFDDWA